MTIVAQCPDQMESISLPAGFVDELRRHIEQYAGPGAEGLVFPKGAGVRF